MPCLCSACGPNIVKACVRLCCWCCCKYGSGDSADKDVSIVVFWRLSRIPMGFPRV